MFWRENKLFIILCVFILIRSALLIHAIASTPIDKCMLPDSPTYEQPALALLHYGQFLQLPAATAEPEVIRTPGYPLMIATVYKFFGERRDMVLYVQVLLDALLIMMLFGLATTLWSPRAGLIAGLFYTFSISAFDLDLLLLSDVPFAFAFAVVLVLGCMLARPVKYPIATALAFGCFAAIACMIRPILYYWIVVLMGWLVFLGIRRIISPKAVIAGIIPWLVIVGGWQLRNKVETGDATFSQIQNVNFYLYRATDILSRKTGRPFYEVQAELQSKLKAETQGMSQIQKYREMNKRGLAIIKSEPKNLIKSQAAGAAKLIFGPASISVFLRSGGTLEYRKGVLGDIFRMPIGNYYRKWLRAHPTLYVILGIEAIQMSLAYLCLLISVVIVARRREMLPIHVFLLITLVYFVVVSAGPEAYSRLRLPIEPILALYGGFALAQLRRKCTRLR